MLDRLFLKPRGIISLFTLAKLLWSDKARANQLAAPPGPEADADHRAAGGEGETEHFGYRQRADVEADAAFRNVDDEAFDPRSIGRGNHETRPTNLDPFVPALAKVFTMSRHPGSPLDVPWRKTLEGPLGREVNSGFTGTGQRRKNWTLLLNKSVTVTVLTTWRCLQRESEQVFFRLVAMKVGPPDEIQTGGPVSRN